MGTMYLRLAALVAISQVTGLAQPAGPMFLSDRAAEAQKRELKRQLPSASAGVQAPFPHRLANLTADDMPALPTEGRKLAGVHRKNLQLGAADGRWDLLPDGRRVWRIAIDAEDAAGWRVHFANFDIAAGRVWVHDGSGEESEIGGPYSGRGPFDDGDFWSDAVLSGTIVIEYESFSDSTDVPFRIDEVSQLLDENPVAYKANATRGASAPCNLDVSCYTDWAETSRSIGHIVFEEGGASYVCSGTLLTTRNRSGIPYFLTADHCISNDAVARTAQTFWLYQTRACNGTPPARRDTARVLGARYLAGGGRSQGDFSLLRLSETPPDAYFSGWNPSDIPEGTEVSVIHHPSGDYKRISFGSRTTPRAGADNFYRVRYTQGVTEGGSSGSGLFSSPGILAGILSSGPKADTPEQYCTINPFIDNFGKFSSAYNVLRDFLEDRTTTGPGPAPSPNATALTSGVSQPFTIEAVQSPVLLNGSRSFSITVPNGAARLEIQLNTQTPNTNVDVFVRHGSDLAVSGGGVVADHRATGPTGVETIVITPTSTPALRAGTYYISLALFTTGVRVTGTLQATVFTTSSPTPPPDPPPANALVSGVPARFSFAAVERPTLFRGGNSYQVTVPPGATRLEIRLVTTTLGVDVDLFARFGTDNVVAEGRIVSDHSSEGSTGDEVILITPSTSPALRAGVYYVSLAVFTTGASFQGTLVATVTGGSGTPPPGDGPAALVSGRSQSFRLDAVQNPTLFNGARSFTVNVPQGASRLEIRLVTETPNVDVDLHVRFSTDPRVASGEIVADHSSTSASGNETIVITAASNPPLRAGTYYISLAVFTAGVAATGQVTATIGTGTPPPSSGPTVLSSGVTQDFQLPQVERATLFNGMNSYVIDVPQDARSLVVQLTAATAGVDVDLYVNHGSDARVEEGRVVADHMSTGPTGAETITITSATSPVLRAGRYYISIAQFTAGFESRGTIRATITTSGPTTPPSNQRRRLQSGVGAKFQLPAVDAATLFNGDYTYTIEVPEDATRLVVQVASDTPSIDVDLFVRRGSDVSLNDGDVVADYDSTGSSGNETLVITPSSAPPIRGGTYYIALALFSKGVPASGTITATFERSLAPAPTSSARPLEIGGEGRLSLPAVERPTLFGGQSAFRVVVPPGTSGLQVILTAQPSSADIDLFVRYGAEAVVADGRVVADHSSANQGGSEAITINSSSSPPLRPGVYFVNVGVYSPGIASEATISVSAPRSQSTSDLIKRKPAPAEEGVALNEKPVFRTEIPVASKEESLPIVTREEHPKKRKYRAFEIP